MYECTPKFLRRLSRRVWLAMEMQRLPCLKERTTSHMPGASFYVFDREEGLAAELLIIALPRLVATSCSTTLNNGSMARYDYYQLLSMSS